MDARKESPALYICELQTIKCVILARKKNFLIKLAAGIGT